MQSSATVLVEWEIPMWWVMGTHEKMSLFAGMLKAGSNSWQLGQEAHEEKS